MARLPIINNLRVVPREASYLDRKLGQRGEIYYDQDNNTLRVYDGAESGGFSMAINDLSNVSNQDFATKAASAGIGGGGAQASGEITIAADDSTQRTIAAGEVFSILGSDGISTTTNTEGALTITNTNNTFNTIAVSGQANVVAETLSDTLTLAAGTNITITTDAATDTITISATPGGGGSDTFATVAVPGQSNVVADSAADTLNFNAGAGISITTDPSTDTITFTNTVSSVSDFTDLSEATTAGATFDQIYLPAITVLDVTNSGSAAYLFDQYTGNNPTLYALNGATIAFKLNVSGHPFLIQTGAGSNYDTGLIHVATDGTVSTGASAQGKTSGTLYWKIPSTISGGYRYQCSVHAPMVGNITIKNFGSI